MFTPARTNVAETNPPAPEGTLSAAAKPTLGELTAASFKVGCLGFGGPAGQIALMHRIFVDEKKWITEPRYLNALNYCMLLPGPEAQQLATYVGWLLHGVRGGVIAGTLFVAPGAAVVFALSWLYAAHADAPVVMGLFFGIKAAVLALVVEALIKIGRRALKTRVDIVIAGLAFAALYVFGAPFPLAIITAALIGLARAAPAAQASKQATRPAARGALAAAALWGALWALPLGLAFLAFGPTHVLTQVGALFSQLSVVTFGGAYAALAYLQQQAVDVHGWLFAAQMIDGLGLAETTPGPLILVNQFVGFVAGWQAEGGGFVLALGCAAMASWCTFAPSFLWIFAGAPYAERLSANRHAAAALKAITAVVLGVITNLALWFALHVLFTEQNAFATPWGYDLRAPNFASLDPFAAILAGAAAFALIRLKANVVVVIALCAVAGLLRP